jgi:hypothetical protein
VAGISGDDRIFALWFGPTMALVRRTAHYHARFAAWPPARGLYFHASLKQAVIEPDDFVATMRSFGHTTRFFR